MQCLKSWRMAPTFKMCNGFIPLLNGHLLLEGVRGEGEEEAKGGKSYTIS